MKALRRIACGIGLLAGAVDDIGRQAALATIRDSTSNRLNLISGHPPGVFRTGDNFQGTPARLSRALFRLTARVEKHLLATV
ncbi:hypothetical protein [Salipiger sp. 1_MG-2023]|uniref:hypothetical protein n=1 Tax=Salipiger sp. 1_MG-2023 TaxID=3062665 RepID=UPI0026E45A7B|nr:hypothetical protein [Salipiger sp. 1_MG-2023]